jgi:hypothetical protein
VTPIAHDPKDDYLIALAREAAVDAIVSSDADPFLLKRIDRPTLSPSGADRGARARVNVLAKAFGGGAAGAETDVASSLRREGRWPLLAFRQ